MRIKTTLDYKIESHNEQVKTAEKAWVQLAMQMDYLRLQLEVAEEKYAYYKKIDLVKELWWGSMCDYIETLIYDKRVQRDEFHAQEMKLRNELIEFLQESIDAICKPL